MLFSKTMTGNVLILAVWLALVTASGFAHAQVRTKSPDRDVYQPPQLTESAVQRVPIRSAPRLDSADSLAPATDPPMLTRSTEPLDRQREPSIIRPASYSVANGPATVHEQVSYPGEFYEPAMSASSGVFCDGCGGGGCGSCGGCDSMGCGPGSGGPLLGHPSNWFGNLELLLMFRKGDVIPALVTTDPATEGATAGTLPNASVLAGNEKIFDEMTAGGRVTVGMWLDACQNQSIVGRLWSGTEADYGFSANQVSNPVLAIPFFDVANNAEATNLIAFPNGATGLGRFGSVSVSGTSNVYGGDVSIRQFWTGGLGTTFDVLYGYQYMQLDESLQIESNSTLTQTVSGTAQAGFTNAITDAFETSNEFHGGEVGLAGRYREGCWSFDFLAKVGFGQVRREATLFGESRVSNGDPPVVVQPDGLLVRQSNEGTFTSSTFGWVPELNVDLGWHYFPRFDVTVGYHLIAMTDTVKLSSLIDRSINDPSGLRPRLDRDYDDWFVHGITFGIRHSF